jgi:hypothetical protein
MIQYTPGDSANGQLLYVAGDALLYIGASSTGVGASSAFASSAAGGMDAPAPTILEALRSDDVIQSVLALLTSRGLSATPAFALAHWTAESTLHVLVRGAIDITVDTAGGIETVSGSGVSTWRETSVAGVVGFALGDAASNTVSSLPLGSGAVWASGARVLVDGNAESNSAASSSPVPASAHVSAAPSDERVPVGAPVSADGPAKSGDAAVTSDARVTSDTAAASALRRVTPPQ